MEGYWTNMRVKVVRDMVQNNMSRSELLRMFVLDVIADDYENLEKIYSDVNELGVSSGLSIQKPEIIDALIGLLESDLASAYKLSGTAPNQKVQGVPSRDKLVDYYFLVTERGQIIQRADDDGWPFEPSGELRKDWVAPEN
jgi:hypothetical protein